MRFLMMFGPMIYSGYNRFMANRRRKEQQAQNNPQMQEPEVDLAKKEKYKEDDLV